MNAIERRRRLDEYKNGFHYPHEYTDDEIKAIASEARAKALDEAAEICRDAVETWKALEQMSLDIAPTAAPFRIMAETLENRILALKEKTL